MVHELLIEATASSMNLSPFPPWSFFMRRLTNSLVLFVCVLLFGASAKAQVYATYYAPVAAPTTVYYPTTNRVTSYYAPTTTVMPSTAYTTTPVTSYYAPSSSLAVTSYYAPTTPMTSYYAPTATPVTSYYAPTAITSYYAPAASTYAPVTVVRTTPYVPGQPIRNTLRAIAY